MRAIAIAIETARSRLRAERGSPTGRALAEPRAAAQIHDTVVSPLHWAVKDGKLDMARVSAPP